MFQHTLHLRPRLDSQALIPLSKVKELCISGIATQISTRPCFFKYKEKFLSDRKAFGIDRKKIVENICTWNTSSQNDAVVLYSSNSLRFTVGVWKDSKDICLLTATLLHTDIMKQIFSQIPDVEWDKKMGPQLATYLRPHVPYDDDLDSKFGLHDYCLHVEVRTGTRSVWSKAEFQKLHAKFQESLPRGNERDTYATFVVVDRDDDDGTFASATLRQRKHAFQSKLCFPWQTAAFSGRVDDTTTVDICLFDERGKPIVMMSQIVPVIDIDHEPDNQLGSSTGDGSSHIREQSEGQVSVLRLEADDSFIYSGSHLFPTHGRRSPQPQTRRANPLASFRIELLRLTASASQSAPTAQNHGELDMNLVLDIRFWLSYRLIDAWHGTSYVSQTA